MNLVLFICVILLNVAFCTFVFLSKGITINHNYIYPPAPEVKEVPQNEDEDAKAIVDAAVAIQRLMLDDNQIDIPEVRNNG